jgi:hypothetical protein
LVVLDRVLAIASYVVVQVGGVGINGAARLQCPGTAWNGQILQTLIVGLRPWLGERPDRLLGQFWIILDGLIQVPLY